MTSSDQKVNFVVFGTFLPNPGSWSVLLMQPCYTGKYFLSVNKYLLDLLKIIIRSWETKSLSSNGRNPVWTTAAAVLLAFLEWWINETNLNEGTSTRKLCINAEQLFLETEAKSKYQLDHF